MKPKLIAITTVCVFLAQIVNAQNSGIRFENAASWQDILTKAKIEHKLVFVDCYATWCGPCKQMDQTTYTIDSIGRFMDEHFICVKVQMDRTKADNDTVKAWYPDAKMLESNYIVRAYPTLMFFDENGKAVHRAVGYQPAGRFMTIARASLDPGRQYYTLRTAYDNGKFSYSAMPVLAKEATALGEKELGEKVASDYIHDYLDKLDEKDFLLKQNVDFITAYLGVIKPQDQIFKLCFEKPAAVDTALHNKDYALILVNKLIYQWEITPKINAAMEHGPEPDWSSIENNISQKFGIQYVTKDILYAKVVWYKHAKDAKNYGHYLTMKTNNDFKIIGIENGFQAMYYNNNAFEVFQYDNDRKDLETALTWVDASIKVVASPGSELLDTKANLLYKLGQKQQGIEIEEQAAQILPKDQEVVDALEKMKKGESTWLDKMQ